MGESMALTALQGSHGSVDGTVRLHVHEGVSVPGAVMRVTVTPVALRALSHSYPVCARTFSWPPPEKPQVHRQEA